MKRGEREVQKKVSRKGKKELGYRKTGRIGSDPLGKKGESNEKSEP